LEAAAAAKQVVATSVGGVPDAVEDGKSGIVIDSDDYESMSQSIVTLLKDEKARLSLGEYARNRVRNRFDCDRIVAQYEKILCHL
jgi:glycosyltransferase involved in cell wall biosynthesis